MRKEGEKMGNEGERENRDRNTLFPFDYEDIFGSRHHLLVLGSESEEPPGSTHC